MPAWAQVALVSLACAWVLGPSRLLPGELAVGRPTRDLFDHVALLDAWFLATDEWNLPRGGSLFPPDLMGMVLATPFLWLGRAAAYNWAILLQLCLAGAVGVALGRRVGSGLVGGVAFALSPHLVGQAFSGEAETTAAWPLALVALLLERGGRRAWVAAGLVGALGAVASWYHGAFVAVVLAAWFLLRGRRLPGAAWAPSTFVVAVAGPAWLYARVLLSSDQLFRGPTVAAYLSQHRGALAATVSDPAVWVGWPLAGTAHTDLLGGVVLLFALLGAWRWRPDAGVGPRWWWVGIVAVALVLALGPVLHVRGVPVLEWTPGRILAWLPGFGLMRLPHRWLVVATLGLAVLAARGAAAFPARWLPCLAAAMMTLETAWFGVPARPATSVAAPAVVAEITGPVLDLPPRTIGTSGGALDDARGHYLVWQRLHRHPVPYALLMQGWSPELAQEPLVVAVAAADSWDAIAIRPREAGQFRQEAFARAVAAWRRGGGDATALAGARGRLAALGLAQVVLHRDLLAEADAGPIETLLRNVLGEPALTVGEGVLWQL